MNEINLINISKNSEVVFSSTSNYSNKEDSEEIIKFSNKKNYSFHTNRERNPWLLLDLKCIYPIEKIILFNRIDTCKERAYSIKVEVSLDKKVFKLIHKGFIAWDDYIEFNLSSLIYARYIKLSLDDFNYFHLAKIEIFSKKVFGKIESYKDKDDLIERCKSTYFINDMLSNSDDFINIALNAKVKFSSYSQFSTENDAKQILTGSNSNDFSFHTDLENNPFVELDLRKVYPIEKIKIFNRKVVNLGVILRSCKIKVEISIDKFEYEIIHQGKLFWKDCLEFELSGMIYGRYIRFSLDSFEYLHLKKIEVYSNEKKIEYFERKLFSQNHNIVKNYKINNFNIKDFKKYALLQRNSSFPGFFSNIFTMLQGVEYCLVKGLIPIIDYENDFDFFYKQPFEIDKKDILNKNQIIVDVTKDLRDSRLQMSHSFFENIELVEYYRYLFINYFKLTEHVQELLHNYIKDKIKNPKLTLGILCRGTDYTHLKPRGHPRQPDTDLLIYTIDLLINKYKYSYIYLATEDIEIYQKIRYYYGSILIDIKTDFMYEYKNKVFLHKYGQYKSKAAILEEKLNYVLSIYALSKCDYFLGGLTSGSFIAKLLLPEHTKSYIFNLGKY